MKNKRLAQGKASDNNEKIKIRLKRIDFNFAVFPTRH
ncbi:MAG: hypothetical protein ACI8ZM_000158 [Crocinitomix sp.]|jgi:hypothetical protein